MKNEVITAIMDYVNEMGTYYINLLVFINDKTFIDGDVEVNRISFFDNRMEINQGRFDITIDYDDAEFDVEETEVGDNYVIKKGNVEIVFVI